MNKDVTNSQIYRDMARHENDLINHRLTWLASFQGLLFAALAFAWGKNNVFSLTIIICLIGAFVALSIGVATKKANTAIKTLSKEWDKIKGVDYLGPDVEGNRSGQGTFSWLMPGSFVPWVFFVGWLLILIIRVCKYS